MPQNGNASGMDLTDFLQNIVLSIYQLDSTGIFTHCLFSDVPFAGRSSSEIIGLSIWNFVALDDQFKVKFALSEAVKSKTNISDLEFRGVTPSGDYTVYSAVVQPLFDDYGIHSEYRMCFTDITEKHRMEQELANANRTKSEFLSKMSHEIRTPLNAIIGLTNIALTMDDIAKVQTPLSKILASSKHLLQIINDILDISRIEAGKFDLLKEEFNFENTLASLLELVQIQADKKNISITVEYDPKIPSHLLGDEDRLGQVFMNLLSNAIKFTPEFGKIHLNVSPGKFEDGRVELIVSVSDTGIGIEKSALKRIFNSFEQADGSLSRKYEGTGLGLAITHSIVELMGGEIQAVSSVGKGSVFTFNAWFEYIKTRPVIDESRRLKILIVYDTLAELKYVSQLLEYDTIEVSCACSGEQAITMVKNAYDNSAKFDCILLDYRVSGMDGLAISAEIEKIIGSTQTLVITAPPNAQDLDTKIRNAGIKNILVKPVMPSKLIDTINTIVEQRFTPPDDSGATKTYDFSEFRALIVEDVEINAEIVEFMLQPTGLQMDFARNGREAVSIYAQNQDAFDIILMDIQMPVMDGYEATNSIRNSNTRNAASIPIIAMTANVFREDIERALNTGMNSHIGKPIYEQVLYEELAKYLTPERRAAKLSRQPTGENGVIPMDIPGVDVDGGLERLRGNKNLYLKLIRNMVETDLLEKTRQNMKVRDYKDARINIHALRGFAANLGLTQITELSAQLEQVFIRSTVYEVDNALDSAYNPNDEINVLFDKLVVSIDQLRKAFVLPDEG